MRLYSKTSKTSGTAAVCSVGRGKMVIVCSYHISEGI